MLVTTKTPPRLVAAYVAKALSCRPAWVAAMHGDRDPQVLAMARTYSDYIGAPRIRLAA